MGIVGSASWLGSWSDPQAMKWSESGWSIEIDATAGEEVEFKFVIVKGGRGGGAVVWEDGPNRKAVVPGKEESGSEFTASFDWSDTAAQAAWEVLNASSAEAASRDGGGGNGASSASVTVSKPEASGGSDGSEESAFAREWAGRSVEFMKSNSHGHERRGKWDSSGLTGVAKALVEADKGAGNWWRKLETVENLLLPLQPGERLEALVYASIYLQWINTGQIACVEDGGHRRPNRHAEISRKIFRWMEREGTRGTAVIAEEVLVMRKIHPRLPAFSADFTASVPLTRIRDIAHRNDIPHDLKQEIKHTIQNKLHRNAGPEDLVATELLLRRVTRNQGEYSEDFVHQLKLFYAELKDFFNASSLTELLQNIRPSLDDTASAMLDNFMACKKKVDDLPSSSGGGFLSSSQLPIGSRPTDVLMTALHALTGLRASLLYSLESGLRNDAPDDSIAMRQKWRLSEICLEEYFFVLISRFLNELFDEEGGEGASEAMAAEVSGGNLSHMALALGGCVLSLRQLGLSGYNQAECFCLENEIASWQAAGVGGKSGVASPEDLRWWVLRLKASLDRMRRLCDSFTETILDLYFERSQKLGSALGIEDNAVRTFAEAEIRASVVFQLAKLTSLLLRVLRTVLNAEGWDVLVPGSATGKLIEVERMDMASLEVLKHESSVVLMVQRAEGDEEVRAAGANLLGVILLQELPHLSHLAVRARQESVPLLCCEDESQIAQLRSNVGKTIRLEAGTEGVKILTGADVAAHQSSSQSTASSTDPVKVAQPVRVQKEARLPVLPLHEAQLNTCGAKAFACKRLEELAITSTFAGADFSVPRSAVITFGVLDDALSASGHLSLFHRLVDELDSDLALSGQALDEHCAQIRSLMVESPLPAAFHRTLSHVFPATSRLIVRSSANVEDLAGLSGAGLYDSIPDVSLSDPMAFARAVACVWASLFTRRAVMSRRVAGVKQGESAMAVLVQELIAPPDLSFVLHTKGIGAGAGGAAVRSHERPGGAAAGGEAVTGAGGAAGGKKKTGGRKRATSKNGVAAGAGGSGGSAISHGPDDFLTAEVAPGLGETLASGTRGTAWRFAVKKSDGNVRILSFANFSEKIIMAPAGGKSNRSAATSSEDSGPSSTLPSMPAGGGVVMQAVDYSGQMLSTSPDAQLALGRSLLAVGSFLEERFGEPQDVEGCVVGDKVYVVQSRPQP